jgi:lauroyl/myristoyl acyltransferase
MLKNKFVSFMIDHLPLSVCRLPLSLLNQLTTQIKDRARIMNSLRSAFGSEVGDRFVVKTTANNIISVARTNVDSLFLLKAKMRRLVKYLKRVITINDLDKLKNYYNQNKGIILLSFHFGSFYLIPPALALHGFKLTVFSGLPRQYNDLFEDRIKEYSKDNGNLGLKLIPLSKVAIKCLVKALREKEIIFLLGDFNMGHDNGTVTIDFLNQKIYAGYGVAWLHSKTGAPIVPIHIDNKNGHYEILVGDSLHIDNALDYKRVTESIFQVFEREIRARPDEWNRWRHFHKILCNGQ